jgi:polysaccharide export outer membrane protein
MLPKYVVDPPDILRLDVLEALPGRPITGERLVRPDGTISLDWYGDLPVAGLTPLEIKVKLIEHLREFLNDETLGLVATNERETLVNIRPADSDRVFVDVAAYNSKVYYVEGAVANPGRYPITGNDSVLDAIHYAGNPTAAASVGKIHLNRVQSDGKTLRSYAINYDEITSGTDASTNYVLYPGDRIVVPRDPDAKAAAGEAARIENVEARLNLVERKLDRVISLLERMQKTPRSTDAAQAGSNDASHPIPEVPKQPEKQP